jgi:eukaryotic-like serine/threonine-protein kinase
MVAFLVAAVLAKGTASCFSTCKHRRRKGKLNTRPCRSAFHASTASPPGGGSNSEASNADEEPVVFRTGDLVAGKYSVSGVLGRGVSGTTFEARDVTKSGQLIALKVLSLRRMRSWKLLDLFKREGNTLKNLSHPAIPDFIDSLELDHEGERLFVLVQRKAEGNSLQELLDSGFRFTVAQVRSIFRQLLEVLMYMSELNPPLLHRDVKPANVIVSIGVRTPSGSDGNLTVSIVDFGAVNSGVSKEERGGFASTLVGSFGYMPPEAFSGGADARSDLYAAAATMMFTVTGLNPSEVPQSRLKLDLEAVVPAEKRLELGNVFTVMRKLLEPAPEDRYRSARQSLEALASRSPSDNRDGLLESRTRPSMQRRGSSYAERTTFSAFDSAFDDRMGYGDGFDSSDSDDDSGYTGRGRRASLANQGSNESARERGSAMRSSRPLQSSRPLRQPAGSRVVLEREPDDRLLRVFVPPRGLTAQSASTGAFALTWTGFVGFWTAGVVTGGAPLLVGLFSLPFWYAGLKMGKRFVDDLRGTTEFVVSAGGGEKEVYFFSLRVVGAFGDVREAAGDSRDLDLASVDVQMYQNGQAVTAMILREGTKQHELGADLDQVEQEWLSSEINSFLQSAVYR